MLDGHDFSDKIVYCPCDSEDSEFVKYLKGKCKELIYTWDDYRNHLDLFKKADVIITNPPFKGYKDFIRFWANDCDEAYLISHAMSCNSTIKVLTSGFEVRGFVDRFKTPDGSIKRVPCVHFYYKKRG